MAGLRASLVLILSLGLILPGKVYNVAVAEGSGWDEGSAGFDEGVPTTVPPTPPTTTRVAPTKKVRTFKTMRKSCELKGKYLEGALPGNRMPTFVSASEAYEACNEEQGCSGLTFTPRIGKWSLRSSSTPKKSKTGEISMAKDCMDVHGLPRYTIQGKRHCYAAMQKKFAKFEDAEKSCDESNSCAGIWDDKCNGKGFYTCANLKDWDEISISKKTILYPSKEKSSQRGILEHSAESW